MGSDLADPGSEQVQQGEQIPGSLLARSLTRGFARHVIDELQDMIPDILFEEAFNGRRFALGDTATSPDERNGIGCQVSS